MSAITSEQRFKFLDNVKYDLNDDTQAEHYENALLKLANMECTQYTEGGLREYKAFDLTETPTFPTHEDFGYENLKSGSTIFDIKTATVYMYSKLSKEWTLL